MNLNPIPRYYKIKRIRDNNISLDQESLPERYAHRTQQNCKPFPRKIKEFLNETRTEHKGMSELEKNLKHELIKVRKN